MHTLGSAMRWAVLPCAFLTLGIDAAEAVASPLSEAAGRAVPACKPEGGQRGKELVARFENLWWGPPASRDKARRWIATWSAEDARLFRQSLPHITNPAHRRELELIFEYLDRLDRRPQEQP